MKKLLFLAAIFAVTVGLWWWESPRLAAENLLDAADDRDVAELAELVDADSFRASLREEFPPLVANPLARPLAARRPAPPAVGDDPLLAGLAGDAQLIALSEAARTDWEIDRRGLDGFRVVRRSGAGEPLAALVFARDGLGWTLVGVERAS